MICKSCKKQIEDDIALCPHCGKVQKKNLSSQMPGSLRAIPLRSWVCIVVLIAALIISAAVFAYSRRPGPFVTESATIYSVTNDGKIAFYYNGKRLDCPFDLGEKLIRQSRSMSGKVQAFMDADALYLVDKKGVRQVTDKVEHYQLSASGDFLAYVNSVGELYRYTRSSGKSVRIDYNVLSGNLCVSSDGTLVYLKEETAGNVMYYCTGKKPQKYAEGDRYPLSVSDGAKKIYTLDGSKNLYYGNGKKELRIGENVDATVYLSADASDILFSSGGASYVYTGGKEAVKLADAVLSPVTCMYLSACSSLPFLSDDTTAICIGLRALRSKFYMDADKNLYYVNKKYGAQKLKDGVETAICAVNGKRVYYVCDNQLTVCASNGKSSVIAEDAGQFAMSKNGRYLYYVDSSGVLWSKHGRMRAKQIAEQADRFSVSGSDYLFYTTVRDESARDLYALRGGGKPRLISESITEYRVGTSAAYYRTQDALFFGKGKNKFKEQD